MKTYTTWFIVAVVILTGTSLAYKLSEKSPLVAGFEECVAAGNPVMESYPRQCRSGGGTFTENIGNEFEKSDLIRVDFPRPNQIVKSPLIVAGEARGNWFFEASFPVVLTDWDGLIIAQGIATAKRDWMTTEFVPFEAELVFSADKDAYSNRGALILRKDNPSGLPENDDALEIPILFGRADNSDGVLALESGVRGKVLLGPACPVMQNPPLPQCADKPYETIIQVIAIGSSKSSPFATVESDKEGNYKAILPPGEYGLQAVGKNPLPRCETKNVTIEPNIILEVNLSCDTGIR
ncbi:MAG: Gmad2 immunoglobulin-like domain-containing protein [Candidatus Paceibacterota bacterium]|jgi:hypothetical protein